jgi:hypothetical protein
MRASQVAALAVLISSAAFCQEYRGAISGAVTDPTGAVVGGATIVATETRTNTKSQTVSDGQGQYTISFLAPGEYEISAEAPGFKRFLRQQIHLEPGDHPIVDISLVIGSATQQVEVSAEVPLVNSENATIGQTITTQQIEDLPLDGRTPLVLAQLTIGVLSTSQPSLVHPFDLATPADITISGTPSQTSEILIDGGPDETWDMRVAYSPPQDAVQQVEVNAFDTDAAYGHTGGGTLDQIVKSGTNSLHGSAWEFNQPNNLDANTFFNNKEGVATPVTHFNQYGVTAGGPVVLPKLNGRNKLFWFYAFEGIKDSQPNTTFLTVPTAAERTGDFSALLAGGSQFQIYNPFSATTSGSTVKRTAFAGNIIPSQYISTIAQAYLNFYPQPNVANPGANGTNNYLSNVPTTDDYNNDLGRMDYNMSDRSHMTFEIRRTGYTQTKNEYFGNPSEGSLLFRNNWGGDIDEVFTASPTTVFDVRLNFTRMDEVHSLPSAGFDPTTLGFPSYMASSSVFEQLPIIALTTYQPLGASGASSLPSQSIQLFGDMVKQIGKHSLKFGVDARQMRLNAITYGDSTGSFSFGNTYDRASSSSSSTVAQGQDLASFLMGLPTSDEFDIETHASMYQYYYAGFVQDDWRIRRNLTFNLGLRWDYELPWSETYDRTVNGFDTTDANPLAAAAIAAYAKNPISQIPAGSFSVPGGLTFASPGSPGAYQVTEHIPSPRVGFAWSPDMFHDKTVIRGGFGIFVEPVTIDSLSLSGPLLSSTSSAFSTSALINQEGFSQSTTVSVPGTVVTPLATLANPFPSGLLTPVGTSAGLATFEGQTISFLAPQMQNPYSIRWDLDIQQTLARNLMLEVAYVGNHSVHIPVPQTQLNAIPDQYLSTLAVRDATVNSALSASTANPFSGLNTPLNTAKTTVGQLLVPYPEFPAGTSSSGWSGSSGIIEENATIGQSFFDALDVSLQKRASGGLLFTGNYMYSKLIEEDTWLNPGELERRISPFDHTQHFVFATTYQLPFGTGRRFTFATRLEDAFFGGWALNGIYTYETGAPIVWSNGSTSTPGDYVFFGGPGALTVNPSQTTGTAFNTALFETNSSDTFAYHLRTFSTTFSNLRADGINDVDASLLKQFNVTEHAYLQLRLEAFNLFNHPEFNAPNVQATSGTFGEITSQLNRTRALQIGARIVF